MFLKKSYFDLYQVKAKRKKLKGWVDYGKKSIFTVSWVSIDNPILTEKIFTSSLIYTVKEGPKSDF